MQEMVPINKMHSTRSSTSLRSIPSKRAIIISLQVAILTRHCRITRASDVYISSNTTPHLGFST